MTASSAKAMPIERWLLSRSQFCELLGVDEKRYRGIEQLTGQIAIVLEPEELMAQTTGSIPQIYQGKGSKKGGKKKGC